MLFKTFNQNNYPNTPYASNANPDATIKSGGCGITSGAIILNNLAGANVDPPFMATYAKKCGARVNGGTDMNVLAKQMCKDYSLTFKITNDEPSLLKHFATGGMAIANVSGNRSGWTGLLSSGGHFVVAAEAQGNDVTILDPGYYTGKFNVSGRKGKVTVDANGYCHIDISLLALDTQGSLTNYWLFSKKETPVISVPTPVLTVINVIVGGQKLSGFLKDNHSFVPARAAMDILKVSFTWDGNVNAIVANGQKIPVIIKDGIGYSLTSEIAKVTNHAVNWDDATKTTTIMKED